MAAGKQRHLLLLHPWTTRGAHLERTARAAGSCPQQGAEQRRGEQRRAEQRKQSTSQHESTPGCCCRVPLVHQVELRPHEAQTTARLGAGSSASQLRPHGFLSGGGLRVLLGLMCLFFLHCFTLSKKETAASYSASLYPDILKGGKREHK